ncbi:MAG: glycosyltransferase [Bdellovibrionales bacterium]
MTARFIIASAVNEYYLPLFAELLQSLLDCKASFAFDIGLLDVGLSESNRRQMATYGVTVRSPGVDVEYPGREEWEKTAPYFRAMTSRPSLPKYFPGYDAYMWMDADTWVQTPEAIEAMLPLAANDRTILASSEDDLAYRAALAGNSRYEMYRNCLGDADSIALQHRPMLSSGFFALSPHAPHWELWRQTLAEQLNAVPEITQKNFMMEQICLNLAVFRHKLDVHFMPPEYHWIVVTDMPAYDEARQHYVLPKPPHRPISVLHLGGEVKNASRTLHTLDGRTFQRPLTYKAWLEGREKGMS